MNKFVGMISSDWSQCLSPNRPFDVLTFHYPEIESDLARIFKRYTGNEISLGQAIEQVKGVLPAWPTPGQMDYYLDACFETYVGVEDLIRWCGRNRVLFMINPTGFIGYFQICGLQCNTADGPKTKQDGAIIFCRGPSGCPPRGTAAMTPSWPNRYRQSQSAPLPYSPCSKTGLFPF
jgi:hypothetical protein